jgi:hypothetical protein
MEKLYAEGKKGILTAIAIDAYENPIELVLENSKTTTRNTMAIDREILFYNYYETYANGGKLKRRILDNKGGLAYKTSLKNRAKKIMVGTCIWDDELARITGVEREFDVEYYHSYQEKLKEYIFRLPSEWKDWVYQKALEGYKIELKKERKYKSDLKGLRRKSFIKSLIGQGHFVRDTLMPRLMVEDDIQQNRDGLSDLRDQMDLLNLKLKTKEISNDKFRNERLILKRKISLYFKESREMFARLFLDEEGNKNFTFMRAFRFEHIQAPKSSTPYMKTTSVRHADDLVKSYVRWYNNNNAEAIREAMEDKKREKDRVRYSTDTKITGKKEAKQLLIDRALQLHSEGKSSREIGTLLGKGKSTITDWINKYS